MTSRSPSLQFSNSETHQSIYISLKIFVIKFHEKYECFLVSITLAQLD